MSRRHLGLLFLLLTLGRVTPARAASPAERANGPQPRIDLVTVGPGSDLFSLWGHVALCVSAGELVDGRCLDFGIATTADPVELALGTLRGQQLFQAVEVPARDFLAKSQWRDVWSQELRLDPQSRERLLAAYRSALSPPLRYAYEPVLDNCATRVRDLLDHATEGQLGADARLADGPPRRLWAEEALSGRALPLFLLALSGSRTLDEASSAFERMAFPPGLREGVAEHLGAEPIRLHTRADQPPPTSRHAGKILLLGSALLASLALYHGQRRSLVTRRALRVTTGFWLGALSLAPIVGALSALPSLGLSPVLALCWPTDALLGFLPPRWLDHYLRARLSLLAAATLVLGWLTSFAILPAALAVGLPLLTLYATLRPNRRDREASSAVGP